MEKYLREVELEGELVRLVPMNSSYKNELLKAIEDGELNKLWFTAIPSTDTIDLYFETVETEFINDKALAFVVIDKKTDKVVGSTRFCNCDMPNRRVEIGYTWYSKSVQRTGINTECKYLLLAYAFEK